MVFHRERVTRFFGRVRLVEALSIASLVVIASAGYIALSSPLFLELPVAARTLYYSHHRDVFAVAVMFLILAAIHSAGYLGRTIRRLLSARVLFPIAQISYSLYLVHEMFMLWLFPKTAALFGPALGAHTTMAVAAVIALMMSFAGATVLYLLVEQPSMRARELPGIRGLFPSGPAAAGGSDRLSARPGVDRGQDPLRPR
jgi:peptidoglycan/LPS O-acetylase OafA/YrhL